MKRAPQRAQPARSEKKTMNAILFGRRQRSGREARAKTGLTVREKERNFPAEGRYDIFSAQFTGKQSSRRVTGKESGNIRQSEGFVYAENGRKQFFSRAENESKVAVVENEP